MLGLLFKPAFFVKLLSLFVCLVMVALVVIVTPGDRIVYAAEGDVEITSLTIAGSATGAQSTSNANYYTYGTPSEQVTLRGTYQLARDVDPESPATVSVLLTCQDLEGYFGGSFKYFTTDDGKVTFPSGSENKKVIQTADGVEVSFTVSGLEGSSATFVIGYTFDVSAFAGWIPDGKLLAEIETGGDVVAANTRTVTAIVAEQNNRFRFVSNSSTDIGIDQYATLDLQFAHNINAMAQWLLEPDTELIMELDYPAAAKVTVPSSPRVGNPPPIDKTTPGTIIWDFGKSGSNGAPINMSYYGIMAGSYSYSYAVDKLITVLFPSSDFSVGDEVTLTAKLTYTLAGRSSPTVRTIPVKYNIIDSFIHMRPLDLEFSNGYPARPVTVDINNSSDSSPSAHYPSVNNIYNDGTQPIPEVCLTYYNGTGGSKPGSGKNNITAVRIHNVGTTFQSRLIYTIEGGAESREVIFTAGKATTVGGFTTVSNSAAGVSLQPGEYIDKIEAYPLDDSSGTLVNALPVGTALRLYMVYSSWSGGKFPDGTPIEQDDYVTNMSELTWKGESRPDTHTSGTIIEKTLDYGTGPGTTVLMRSLPGDPHRSVFYGFNPIYPNVSFAYQTGENGSKAPTQTLGVNLRFSQYYDVVGTWVDPIIYYVPPAHIEVDTGQPLQVYLNSNNSIVPGVAATVSQVTLGDMGDIAAYKFSITGGLTVPNNASGYYIPLTLTVRNGSKPGNYNLHHRTDIGQGLLFGTMAAPHSYIYGDIVNQSLIYNDIVSDLDGNPQTHHLVTVNSPTNVVSALSKLDAKAEMYNDFSDEWQKVNKPAAEATVSANAAGEGSFRLIVTNSGNSYIGDIRLLDILPFQGADEKTVLNPTIPKGSEWTAALKYEPVVTVFNSLGEDKTAEFAGAYSIQYCSNGDPSYSGGTTGNTIQRTGGTVFTNNASFSTAKSFLFNWSSTTMRLPPGYELVIEGIIKAPDGVMSGDDGKVAYNSFAAQAQYFAASSGGSGTAASLSEPVRQKFILRDMGDAEIDKEGFVFKDLDDDGKYSAPVDAFYEGVTVELWRSDASGNPEGAGALGTVTSDEKGQYAFHMLSAGDYLIKFIKPDGTAYEFAERGTDGNNADSHVDLATGIGSKLTVSAGDIVQAPTNAGIKATGLVTVGFYAMSPGKTPIGSSSVITVPVNEAIAAIAGSAKAGSGPGEFAIPSDYHLKVGETNQKTYAITWESAEDLVGFEVEPDIYAVSYSYTGTVPAGAPAVPAAQDCDCYASVSIAEKPTMKGYEFSGWTPTAASGITVSGTPGSFTMPGNAVEFEGNWSEQDYSIHYHANGGIGSAMSFVGKIGSTVTLPVDEFRHTEYDLLGFDQVDTAPVATFSGADLLLDEAVIDVLFPAGSNEATLYAVWSGNGNGNGGGNGGGGNGSGGDGHGSIYTLPPTPAYNSSPIQTATQNSGNTGDTGDNTDILSWFLALFLSLIGILSILLWRLRRPAQ